MKNPLQPLYYYSIAFNNQGSTANLHNSLGFPRTQGAKSNDFKNRGVRLISRKIRGVGWYGKKSPTLYYEYAYVHFRHELDMIIALH